MIKQWTPQLAEQWKMFVPPARPSISELAVIEKHLLQFVKERRNFRLLILGSTPEYRDLALTYFVDYACVDYNKQNFLELGKYMYHRDSEKNVIEGDWHSMTFSNEFDMVIGDFASAVIPVSDHDVFFGNIYRALRQGGMCILKTALREGNKRPNHKEMVERYRNERSYLNPFPGMLFDVLLMNYDFEKDTMDCSITLEALKNSHEIGIFNDYEFDEIAKRLIANGKLHINVPLKNEFIKNLQKIFHVEITSGSDWYKDGIPLILLRKND